MSRSLITMMKASSMKRSIFLTIVFMLAASFAFASKASELLEKNVKLEGENKSLKQEVDKLTEENKRLTQEMDELKNGESRLMGIIRNSYATKDYKTTSATIETLKAKHPETQYIAECDKMLSAIDEWKQEQERIRLENMSKLGIWTVRYYVDNFGNLTEKGYITTAKPITGRFSNSANTNRELNVVLLIDTNSVCIQLYRFGNSLQKASTRYPENYDIQVQDDNGEVYKLRGTNTSDRVLLEHNSGAILLLLLAKSKTLKFYMVEEGSYGSTYNFNIDDTSYYENAIRMLTEG